jgi:hypothetical protein
MFRNPLWRIYNFLHFLECIFQCWSWKSFIQYPESDDVEWKVKDTVIKNQWRRFFRRFFNKIIKKLNFIIQRSIHLPAREKQSSASGKCIGSYEIIIPRQSMLLIECTVCFAFSEVQHMVELHIHGVCNIESLKLLGLIYASLWVDWRYLGKYQLKLLICHRRNGTILSFPGKFVSKYLVHR